MSRRVGAGTILVLGLSFACAKRAPEPPGAVPRGESTYRVLAEAEVTAGAAEPSAETITAILPFAENGPPSYPDAALRSGCREGVVPVRVHVGIDGRVSESRRIPGRTVTDDVCSRMFEDSVRRALDTWRFVPAYQVRHTPADDPGREPTVERVPLGLDVDYEFVFTVVDGKGTVRSR